MCKPGQVNTHLHAHQARACVKRNELIKQYKKNKTSKTRYKVHTVNSHSFFIRSF